MSPDSRTLVRVNLRSVAETAEIISGTTSSNNPNLDDLVNKLMGKMQNRVLSSFKKTHPLSRILTSRYRNRDTDGKTRTSEHMLCFNGWVIDLSGAYFSFGYVARYALQNVLRSSGFPLASVPNIMLTPGSFISTIYH